MNELKSELYFTQGLLWFVAALVSLANGWNVMGGCYLVLMALRFYKSAMSS